MGWGARTHEGTKHTRPRTPVRLTAKLHNGFKPGGRGVIAGCRYRVADDGSIRRAITITKGRAAA